MFYVFHIVLSFVDMFYTSMNIFYKQNIQHDFASIDILGWLTVVKKALIATNPKKIFLFFSIWVFCHEHSRITGLQGGEGGGHFLDSSLPLPPASQTLRH